MATQAKPNRQVLRKQRTLSRLLDAAHKVFLEKGVDGTTTTDITETADVAYGTFYNYFKSVSDMVPVIVEDILQKHLLEVRELQAPFDDSAMRLAIGLHTFFSNVMSGPAIKWLTQKPTIMAEAISNIVVENAKNDITRGIKNGDLRLPCDFITLEAFCVWGVTGALNEVSQNPEQLHQYADNMTKIYLRILGVDDSEADKLVKNCQALTP